MGNSSSSHKGSLAKFYESNGADVSNTLARLNVNEYQQLCKTLNMPVTIGVSGGAEQTEENSSCIGGFDGIQDYGNSMYSKAKEKLIRDIAEDVFKALKSSGVKNVRTAPIEEVVKKLVEALPPTIRNPRKFNSNFKSNSAAQTNVCEVLGMSLNKHYAGALIDLKSDKSEMCGKIAEVMHSLLAGLHAEFMNVAGDVMRVMNNMRLAQDFLDRAYKKQKEIIESSSDERMKNSADETDKVYKAVKDEYNRQMAILSNLVSVSIGPTGESLITSLEDNRDFVGLVKNIKSELGTSQFSDKLSYLLSGVSSAAHSADLIDKALKKIGMAASEFKSASNAGELRSKVFKHIMNSNPSSKQLDDMMKAARVIYEANYDHQAVSNLLAKKGGDDMDEANDMDADEMSEVEGGDDEGLPAYWSKKNLKTKIESKAKGRDLVLKDFRKQLQLQLRLIVEDANNISKHIGESIPVTDDLKTFVDAFKQLPSLDKDNIHIALSGYPRDSTSKETREVFMYKYDTVIKAAEVMSKGPQGHMFKSVMNNTANMLKLIDNFKDKMVKALTEIHIDNPDEIAASLKKTASTFYGSGDSGDDVFGTGAWVAFDKVKNEMDYYYAIANVKTNLARSHGDLKTYSTDYEQILGEEAAWIIDRIKTQYNTRVNTIKVEVVPGAPGGGGIDTDMTTAVWRELNARYALAVGLANANAQNAAKKSVLVAFENLKSLWKFQMDSKIEMIKAAQAVDLYLKAFTDGIAANPDSISNVVKMLNEVEHVAKWFNDKSGDQLAELFDVFPSHHDDNDDDDEGAAAGEYLGDAAGVAVQGKDAVVDDQGVIKVPFGDNNHYYQYVEPKFTANKYPGNPYQGRDLSGATTTEKQCKGIITLSQKVIKSMRALENILSAFSSVGSKFGDVTLVAKTFMTPGQIFTALCNYVAASSFTNGFMPTNNDDKGSYECNDRGTGPLDNLRINKVSTQYMAGTRVPLAAANVANMQNAQNAQNVQNVDKLIGRYRNNINIHSVKVGVGLSGPGAAAIAAGLAPGFAPNAVPRKFTSLAMSSIPSTDNGWEDKWQYHDTADTGTEETAKVRMDMAGWRDNFFDTDLLFQMTIKSVVAKIFTVVDAYRLFHRPVSNVRAHYSLNPLRTILGGDATEADGGAVLSKVKVIPEAMELYYRLVLLAEWYRENFGIESNAAGYARVAGAAGDSWRVTIVPSIDGIWSDLVKIVFDQAEYVKDGNYTETQVQKLVLSINDIWKAYRSRFPKSTTRSILNAFVLEMNRAFGFLRQADITAYLDNRRANLTDSAYGDNQDEKNFLDFDILNANDQFGSRPAPSDRFSSVSTASATKKKERSMVFLQKAVEKLRTKIDKSFLQETAEGNWEATTSFREALKNYRNELTLAKSDTEEYKVILRMLQGANKYVNQNADKLIMVHEAVVAPLSVLYSVYQMVAKFNAFCHGVSLGPYREGQDGSGNFAEWNMRRVAGVPANAWSGELNNDGNTRAAYKEFLKTKYTKLNANHQNVMLDTFVAAMMGDMKYFKQVAGGVAGAAGVANAAGVAAVAVDAKIPSASVHADNIMRDLLSILLDFSTNPSKLITVAISSNGVINIDMSSLEEACKDLLSNIKDNAKKLRNSFADAKIVDKYEDVTNVGSTRWLEENLIQMLFNDRDHCGISRGMVHLKNTYTALCYRNAAGINAGGDAGDPNAMYQTLDEGLRELVYYNSKPTGMPNTGMVTIITEFPGNAIATRYVPSTTAEKDALVKSGNNLDDQAQADLYNKLYPAPVILFESDATINTFGLADINHKSLLVSFNKLVHNYIHMSVDDGTSKSYAPLFESYIASAGAFEVLQGKAFPNMRNANNARDIQYFPMNSQNQAAGGANADRGLQGPPEGSVLFASNATLMRSIVNTVTSVGNVQQKRFLYENLATMPEHIKDRMRVNLPLYSKLFTMVAERATLLKTMLNNTDLKKNIASAVIDNEQGVAVKVAESVDLVTRIGVNTADNTLYFDKMLSRLAESAFSLRKCADGVYKELQDKPPVFFETSKDFLVDFRQRNGGTPFMPYSLITAPLNMLDGFNVQAVPAVQAAPAAVAPANIPPPPPPLVNILPPPAPLAPLAPLAPPPPPPAPLAPLAPPVNVRANGQAAAINAVRAAITKAAEFVQATTAKENQRIVAMKIIASMVDNVDKNTFIASAEKLQLIITDMVDEGENVNQQVMDQFTKALQMANALQIVQGAADNTNGYTYPSHKSHLLLPVRENGSDVFKFNMATRLLLANSNVEVDMNHFPGAKELYNGYASTVDKNILISPVEFTNTVKHTVSLSRFMTDGLSAARLFKEGVSTGMFGRYDAFKEAAQIAAGDAGWPVAGKFANTTVNVALDSINDVVALVENTNVVFSKNKVSVKMHADRAGDQVGTSDRKKMRVFNILDSGIVPLNVHAFMREVPFVNLFNYSYTFDRMIHDFIMPDFIKDAVAVNPNEPDLMVKPTAVSPNTRNLLVKLLVYPYADLDSGIEYFNTLASLFNGNDNLRLGRPKYLSDQLWHKVLLTSSARQADVDDTRIESVAARQAIQMANNEVQGNNANPVNTAHLKVWDNTTKKWINGADPVGFDADVTEFYARYGKLRFDTRLVRNLTWFVQIQRIMRVVLTTHLSWINSPVVRGLKIADPAITEYEGNEVFDHKDYTGENYSTV